MTTSFVCKALIVAAALSLIPSWAHAEPKAPKKPTVYHADVCQRVALKGAVGSTDMADGVEKDTAMMCQTKSSVRVLRDWRVLGFGDGDMFVVGR